MSGLYLDESALEKLLLNLKHFSIDIARLKPEPEYKWSRGGSCEVQVATLDSEIPSARKLVAAKKLFFGNGSSEPKILAFRLARELKVWADLCHPHVLPLLGFYLDDGYKTAMLISEYMPYGDLTGYLAEMTLGYFERLHLVQDLTDGLAYLHSQTIRHGDLKPGNVLVNPQRRALLADFGLSSTLDAGPTGFTTSNGAAATVRFSSPEILLQGEAGRQLANDIWSWGCLVLGVLADKIPFPDLRLDSQLIIAHISRQTPCSVETLAFQPPQLNDLVVKCWNQEPNQRPDVADCLSSIQSALISLRSEMPPAQTPAPQEAPSNQPNPNLQRSPQVPPQPALPGRPMQFHEFFTVAFNNWLAQRQLTLDPPRVDGKEVELHKLFLMVGALGGCRAVFEKKLWPVIGAKIGFPYFNGPLPYSKPEVADQLSKIYQKSLADFEVHWYKSLRPRDPTSIFPLPQPLQYLHREIERLSTAQFPLPQQQLLLQQQLGRAGPPQQPDGNARGPTPNQMAQQTQQLGQSQAATQQQEVIMRNQQGMTFSSQPGPSGQGGPMAGVGIPNLSQLPVPLQQLFTNPEVRKLSPEELKRRGLSDEIIQMMIEYRNQLVPETVPLLPGLNVPPEQLVKAQEKVRAAIALFQNKSDYSSINLTPEQAVLLEASINQTQSLLKQVTQDLVSFVVLAPNDEHELKQVAQTVVTLSEQAQLLQKQPPEKRFIFGLGDLNNYRLRLMTFLTRFKDLQGQAVALQNQGAFPPPVTQQPPAAPLQPLAPIPMRPPTAELPRPPISSPPAGAIAQHQLLSQASVVAPPKLTPAEVPGTSRPEVEQPSLKRSREDEITGPDGSDGSAGPSGCLKRVRRAFGDSGFSGRPESQA